MRRRVISSFHVSVVACLVILGGGGPRNPGFVKVLAAVDSSLPARGDTCTMSQHCSNGGTCVSATEEIDHRHCICKEGFSGPRCSRHCPLECLNGGYCTQKARGGALGAQEQSPTYQGADYMCKCFGLFTGANCETPYKNCGDKRRCYYGGTCIPKEDEDFSTDQPCRCQPGYGGPFCETVELLSDEDTEIAIEKMQKGGKWTLSILLLSVSVVLFVVVKRCRNYHKWSSVYQYEENNDVNLPAFMTDSNIDPRTRTRPTTAESPYSDRGAVELHVT